MEATERLKWILKSDLLLLFFFAFIVVLVAYFLGGNVQEGKDSILSSDKEVLMAFGVGHEVGGARGILRELGLEVVLLVDVVEDSDVLVFRLSVLKWVLNAVPVNHTVSL